MMVTEMTKPMFNMQKLANKLGPRWKVIGTNMIERKPRIVNTCSCGQTYTLSEFRKLHFVGYVVPGDGLEPTMIEQRNCESCKSNRSIELTNDGKHYIEGE